MEITHDIEFGQVYRDSRTDEKIQLVYLDRNVYVFQAEDGSHRIGSYDEFHDCVESGRYNLDREEEPFATTGVLARVRALREDYSSDDGRTSDHKEEALDEALAILTDIGFEEDMESVPFESLDNIGKTAAENLRAEGYETVGDLRHASDEELTTVSWVGNAGVDSIRKWCK